MHKQSIKDIWHLILFSNLLKVGLISLLISWLPNPIQYSFETVTLFTVFTFFSGCLISTILFEKEFSFKRENAFQLGFQLSTLSASGFFALKILLMPTYSFSPQFGSSLEFRNTIHPQGQGLNSFLPNNLAIILLVIAGVLYYLRMKQKKVTDPN